MNLTSWTDFAALGGARRTSGASSRERSGGRKDWERQDRDSEGRETSEHREVIWGSGINASASSLDGFPSIDRLLYGLGLPSSPRKCWGLSCMILKTYSPDVRKLLCRISWHMKNGIFTAIQLRKVAER